jgi:hypothetical protein
LEEEENMTYYNPGSVDKNLRLSVAAIKDFVGALPLEELTSGLSEKKKRADAALKHLDSFFSHNHRDDPIDEPEPCGPKPTIP